MEEIQGMSDAEKEIMEIIWNSGGSIYIAGLEADHDSHLYHPSD